ERLGGHARGTLARRDRRKVGSHLRECSDCLAMAAEAAEVERGLHLIIAPLVLGGAGAAWLASQQRAENAPTASGPGFGGSLSRVARGGGAAGGSVAVSSGVTTGRVVAFAAAGIVTATMVALAAVALLGQEPQSPRS